MFEPYTFVPVEKKIDKEGNSYFKNFDLHAKIINYKYSVEVADDLTQSGNYHIIM